MQIWKEMAFSIRAFITISMLLTAHSEDSTLTDGIKPHTATDQSLNLNFQPQSLNPIPSLPSKNRQESYLYDPKSIDVQTQTRGKAQQSDHYPPGLLASLLGKDRANSEEAYQAGNVYDGPHGLLLHPSGDLSSLKKKGTHNIGLDTWLGGLVFLLKQGDERSLESVLCCVLMVVNECSLTDINEQNVMDDVSWAVNLLLMRWTHQQKGHLNAHHYYQARKRYRHEKVTSPKDINPQTVTLTVKKLQSYFTNCTVCVKVNKRLTCEALHRFLDQNTPDERKSKLDRFLLVLIHAMATGNMDVSVNTRRLIDEAHYNLTGRQHGNTNSTKHVWQQNRLFVSKAIFVLESLKNHTRSSSGSDKSVFAGKSGGEANEIKFHSDTNSNEPALLHFTKRTVTLNDNRKSNLSDDKANPFKKPFPHSRASNAVQNGNKAAAGLKKMDKKQIVSARPQAANSSGINHLLPRTRSITADTKIETPNHSAIVVIGGGRNRQKRGADGVVVSGTDTNITVNATEFDSGLIKNESSEAIGGERIDEYSGALENSSADVDDRLSYRSSHTMMGLVDPMSDKTGKSGGFGAGAPEDGKQRPDHESNTQSAQSHSLLAEDKNTHTTSFLDVSTTIPLPEILDDYESADASDYAEYEEIVLPQAQANNSLIHENKFSRASSITEPLLSPLKNHQSQPEAEFNEVINATVEPEPEPEPEAAVPDEDIVFAEPSPDWDVAKSTWLAAWEVHVYSAGVLFAMLALYSTVALVRLWRLQNLLSRGYFLSLNTLLLLVGLVRAVFFLVDGYNANATFPPPLAYFMLGISFPCLTSAFSILLLALYKTTQVRKLSRRVLKPVILALIISTHFILSISTDIVVGYLGKARVMLIVCQVFFVLWGLGLFGGYIFLFHRLLRSARRRCTEMIRVSESYRNLNGSPRKKPPKFTLELAMKVTLVAAVLGLFAAGLQIYAIVGVFHLDAKSTPEPWPWWAFQFSMRLIEIGMCFTMSYVATQPLRMLRKNDDNGDTCDIRQCCLPCQRIFTVQRFESLVDIPDLYKDYQCSSNGRFPNDIVENSESFDITSPPPAPAESFCMNKAGGNSDFINTSLPRKTNDRDATLNGKRSRPLSMLVDDNGFIRFREEGETKDAPIVYSTDDELGSCGDILDGEQDVISNDHITPGTRPGTYFEYRPPVDEDSKLQSVSMPNTGTNTPLTPRSFYSADSEGGYSEVFNFRPPSSIHLRESIDRALNFPHFSIQTPEPYRTPDSISRSETLDNMGDAHHNQLHLTHSLQSDNKVYPANHVCLTFQQAPKKKSSLRSILSNLSKARNLSRPVSRRASEDMLSKGSASSLGFRSRGSIGGWQSNGSLSLFDDVSIKMGVSDKTSMLEDRRNMLHRSNSDSLTERL